MKILTVNRPYLLTFVASGHSYPLTSEDAQRLLNEYPAVRATKNRVVLDGGGDGLGLPERSILTPATIGGGPAFLITR